MANRTSMEKKYFFTSITSKIYFLLKNKFLSSASPPDYPFINCLYLSIMNNNYYVYHRPLIYLNSLKKSYKNSNLYQLFTLYFKYAKFII